MKPMILTGLGSEQDFETGTSGYFLIFNNGELRVPVSEKAAEIVVKEMYGGESTPENPIEQSETSNDNSSEDDDGIGQI